MNKLTIPYPYILIVLLFVVVSSSPAFGHKVRIFAWQEGDFIHTESKFSGGRAARGATISVTNDAEGADTKILLRGTTDSKGQFSFQLPKTDAATLNIIVDSGDGHKNSWLHSLSPSLSPVEAAATQPTASYATGEAEITEQTPATAKDDHAVLTKADLELVVSRVLEEKLAPLRRSLAENQNSGPSIQDILGGIGYILGLAGIAAYFKSRNSKQ